MKAQALVPGGAAGAGPALPSSLLSRLLWASLLPWRLPAWLFTFCLKLATSGALGAARTVLLAGLPPPSPSSQQASPRPTADPDRSSTSSPDLSRLLVTLEESENELERRQKMLAEALGQVSALRAELASARTCSGLTELHLCDLHCRHSRLLNTLAAVQPPLEAAAPTALPPRCLELLAAVRGAVAAALAAERPPDSPALTPRTEEPPPRPALPSLPGLPQPQPQQRPAARPGTASASGSGTPRLGAGGVTPRLAAVAAAIAVAGSAGAVAAAPPVNPVANDDHNSSGSNKSSGANNTTRGANARPKVPPFASPLRSTEVHVYAGAEP
ncbi:hypothetical protein HYH03_011259 [Edaphochlamys debaryana]|uniref:Uncharacterized protein n=1 Tax=Edaphochlamys debaryana TaxID=47281 RepID=A0A835XU60_9CHLO|nr:hypothetical protein HYH03_011259 [Edaphochlamys debaryana]|eukprot:KAG2490308.1 hypothetical protein HYH03_011259 [Edaphochlamys debaryana]